MVPLKDLQALTDGKDADGTLWYKPDWTMAQAKENAALKWSGAFAAEGYPKGDEHRKPNSFTGGITRHATGQAIDATFIWNWTRDGEQKVADEVALQKLKEAVNKTFEKQPRKRDEVLAALDKYIARGSFSATASATVGKFGLKRPVLHAVRDPEDWHYEEKK
jgi:hypothetical protein